MSTPTGHKESLLAQADPRFMEQALRMARGARGMASPNPGVAAVVVREGVVVGRGIHVKAGDAHAEVLALAEAGEAARGATLYVTLEPCHHQGRTPPCTRAIMQSGLKRVVYGASDPNPKVKGGGGAYLQAQGLEVVGGVKAAACIYEHRFFFTHILKNRPHVILKTAATLDGKVNINGDSRLFITGPASQRLVHTWRREVDGVAIGRGTALTDDPALNCRLAGDSRQPLRLVVDSRLSLSPAARLFQIPGGSVLLACTEAAPLEKRLALARAGAEIILLPSKDGQVDLAALLSELGQRRIISLLVEAGPGLAWGFLAAHLVDEVRYFWTPKLLGGSQALSMVGGAGFADLASAPFLKDMKVRRVEEDLLITGALLWPE